MRCDADAGEEERGLLLAGAAAWLRYEVRRTSLRDVCASCSGWDRKPPFPFPSPSLSNNQWLKCERGHAVCILQLCRTRA